MKAKTNIKETVRKEIRKVLKEATLKDLIQPLRSKLESMGYEVDVDPSFGFPLIEAFKTMPNGSILRMTVQPSEDEIQKKIGQPVLGETIDVSFTLWTTKVTKKLFGLYRQKSRDMQRLPDEAGINIDLGTGMFDIPVEQSVTKVLELLKKAEAKVEPMKEVIRRLQEDTEYQEFFKKAMKKFDISSPAELKDPAKKKEFFDWIDANYKGKSE